MPTLKEHLRKAIHNEDFYSSFDLEKTPYLDWVVNGIFYSALHYMGSYFATQNQHPGDHLERNRLIEVDPNLGRNFYISCYRDLKDDSEDARYRMRTFIAKEIRQDIIPLLKSVKQFLNQYVKEIK